MDDHEKVIEALQECKELYHGETCTRKSCPYYTVPLYCHGVLLNDAIALLKEQETGVSPKEIKLYPGNVWACGNCGHVAVGSADYKAKYCPECGRAVKWDD